MNPVTSYVNDLRSVYGSGQATEHSYRPALLGLLEGLDDKIQVINEPQHATFGAPDLALLHAGHTLGYIECKNLTSSLDKIADSNQLQRYRENCGNLILTNYREFRWYRGGNLSQQVTVARLTAKELLPLRENYNGLVTLIRACERSIPGEITTPEHLARLMADFAHEVARRIRNVLKKGGRASFLFSHKSDLEKELFPPLNSATFADMYAQTVVYALFAARVQHTGSPEEFTLPNALFDLSSNNPFLQREFRVIVNDMEPEVQEIVGLLVQHLSRSRVDEILEGFGRRTEQRNPIIHFYEDFLDAYNPDLRKKRGVYFTPDPVVGYIVRSVDSLLRNHFAKRDGLASENVHILDPAVGTGSFLLKAIEQALETMRGQRGIWHGFLRENLLPRLYGFEMLIAPYTLAHLSMTMFLSEIGYVMQSDERLHVYMTDSLSEGIRKEQLWEDYILAEANAAAAIKNDAPVMVVLGNPPYSGHSANKGKWIQERLQSYYRVDGVRLNERNPKWLQDDYVKFIRFGQWRIERNGEGVLAFITNHAWLDNPTFRGMRQSLLDSFSEIYVLDLHGNSKKKETTPEGNKDENVFEIQQGVSIAFFVRHKGHKGQARVFHSDCWGLRRDKYIWLNTHDVEDSDWQEIFPQSPSYFFVPFDYEGWREYEQGWKVTDIFPVNSVGIVTSRDKFVLDLDQVALRKRIIDFRDPDISDEENKEKYGLADKQNWSLSEARSRVREEEDWESFIQPCLYRPFDTRFMYNHPAVLERDRSEVMQHMLQSTIEQMSGGGYSRTRHCPPTVPESNLDALRSRKHNRRVLLHLQQDQGDQLHLPALPLPEGVNLAMMTSRGLERERVWDQVTCTQEIATHHSLSVKEVNYLFPLYLYDQTPILDSQSDAPDR